MSAKAADLKYLHNNTCRLSSSYFFLLSRNFPTFSYFRQKFLLFKILGRVQYVILSVLYVCIVMSGVYTQGSI